MIAHWDEVPKKRAARDELGATWTFLGAAAGTRNVGVNRIQIDPARRSTPAHVHQGEEEIFFVVGGSGLSWQDGETFAIRTGDCLVHRAGAEAHTLIAGLDGLDVLAFSTRAPAAATYLPYADAVRFGRLWLRVEVLDGRPFEHRDLPLPEPSPRPERIVNVEDAKGDEWRAGDDMGALTKELAGKRSVLAGLNLDIVPPGLLNTAPHFHSAEEEVFVVIDGEGTLLLGDEEHPVRRGHVVARPPGTKVAHAFRGGDTGITVLLYGTREPNDMTYYPRSDVFALRGIGLLGRVERVSRDEVR
ncbi:MAG TPA: cupin domain-containing protein [Gaiellaceae bacterium]|nr:cupin domain-containing protein [Gaiellaceae bacterium]